MYNNIQQIPKRNIMKTFSQIAKELLSSETYKKVLSHCEITEFNKEDAFHDILKSSVDLELMPKDTINILRGNNQELVKYVVSKVGGKKVFEDFAVREYTEYSNI
jgi:hypothetical protein